ncbi:MAG: EAL domain-containing protein [Cycloclasticus sp.]
MSTVLVEDVTNAKKYQVLLVEDDLTHAELISRSFEYHEQFQLTIVHTLCDARRSIADLTPDLIITDFRLPDGDGNELITEFKKKTGRPIILMTSFGDEIIAVNAMKAGASDYVVKTDTSLVELPSIASRALREWRLILDKSFVLEQQSRLTAILEATPDLICIADIDGFLTYLNRSGRNLLGISDQENIRKIRLSDFHAPEDARLIVSDGIPYAIEHGVWTHETTFISKSKVEILTSLALISHKSASGHLEFFSTVARDIRYIRSAEEKIQYLAYYDTLTDLPNRNELLRRLDFEIARVSRQKSQSALLFIDLDNFKYVNDSLGHPTGDLVLKEMALRLKSVVRAEDIVARLGGDEFVVILTNLSVNPIEALNQAREVSKKINIHISMDMPIGEMTFNLTASIGISMFSNESVSGHELLRFADTAMYEAKRSGKNQSEVFHHDMGEDVTRLLELEHKLRKASTNKEFVLFYQTKVNAQTGKMDGAEALIRWDDPDKGLMAPGVFLDVLESSGLINEVGNWVIEESFNQLAMWIAEGLWNKEQRLSINISARQFHDNQFSGSVIRLLEKINVPATCIDLEVTEHSVINDVTKAVSKMNVLIDKGITFSLDDFGTGYSSLGYLKALPVATLKIDKSFINDVVLDKSDQALVTSIIAISKNLGLTVVAEGVETKEQMLMLKEYQCEILQGYYFSKPIPADKFKELLISL